jgi:hypothetical protein
VVYSLFFIPPKNLGDPGSSRGTLERIRVDLTVYTVLGHWEGQREGELNQREGQRGNSSKL